MAYEATNDPKGQEKGREGQRRAESATKNAKSNPGQDWRVKLLAPNSTVNAKFSWPVRIYYEDTDAGGVVYHANYLRFMERARSEWLRELGHPIDQIVAQEKRVFVVRSVEMKFLRPARLGELLQVSAQILELKRASMRLAQEVVCEAEGGPELRVSAVVELAMVSSETFRPVAIPEFLRQ